MKTSRGLLSELLPLANGVRHLLIGHELGNRVSSYRDVQRLITLSARRRCGPRV
jgi:hypothetical protein